MLQNVNVCIDTKLSSVLWSQVDANHPTKNKITFVILLLSSFAIQ